MTVHVAEPFVDLSGEQPVRGFLHRPISPSGIGIVLNHGAGGKQPVLFAGGAWNSLLHCWRDGAPL
jgi:hypothetical protein